MWVYTLDLYNNNTVCVITEKYTDPICPYSWGDTILYNGANAVTLSEYNVYLPVQAICV